MNLHEPKTANVLGFFLSKRFLLKKYKLNLYILFLSTIFFSQVNAQSNISLRGQVTDSTNGFPLPNVLIQVEGEIFQTYSNQEGYFEIENIEPGNYSVKFTLIGYEPYTIRNIVISEDITAQILVDLKKIILQGETIEVEAKQIENIIRHICDLVR